MLASSPPERAGGASGMLGTARLTGQTIGTAVVALIFNLMAADGTRVALVTATILALIAMVLSSLRLTPGGSSAQSRARSEEHTTEIQSLMRRSYAVIR